MRAVGIRADEKNSRTHSLAARIMRALRSRRLASRFSAVSSHTAFPPASSGAALTDVAEVRPSRW